MRRQDWDIDKADFWPAFTDLFTGVLGVLILLSFPALMSHADLVQEVDRVKEERDHYLSQRDSLLQSQLGARIADGTITVGSGKIDIQGLVLFSKGSATLSDTGKTILEEVAPALVHFIADSDDMIMVSGFTDDLEIRNQKFPSNWELSVIRATNVVRYLIESGFPEGRIFAAGFGEFHPKVSNSDEENRSQNRRVEIIRVPNMEKDGA